MSLLTRLSVFSVLATATISAAPGFTADSLDAKPMPMPCPTGVPATVNCLGGKDSAGAYYLIALPEGWAGTLVLHAHGGPELGAPSPARAAEDLTRWSIMVRAGYAWAGSTFRQGGVEVRAAAEDTERLRKIFIDHVGKPRRTVLHGQSWGASVAAKGAEMFTAQKPYDAVLLTSGVLGGGTRSYDFRLDLRAVYQYLCNNHPRPDEAEYPANIGLPSDSVLKNADIAARAAECLGLDKPAAQRTPEQQRKVETLEKVIKIPASSIQGHLNWATFHFRDIVSKRTGGASPFGNSGVRYIGSANDDALNAGVRRYQADPAAVARFGADTDPTGKIPVPVLTMKWIDDPTAFVELDAQFKETMARGGNADRLVQTFVTTGAHSYASDPTYPALMTALLEWAETGVKPTPDMIAARCLAAEAQFGAGCTFAPAYTPAALETRVAPRDRP